MLSGLGHTDEKPTNSVLGPATSMEDVGYRLAASCGEGRKTFGGMTNKGDVKGGVMCCYPRFYQQSICSTSQFSRCKWQLGSPGRLGGTKGRCMGQTRAVAW